MILSLQKFFDKESGGSGSGTEVKGAETIIRNPKSDAELGLRKEEELDDDFDYLKNPQSQGSQEVTVGTAASTEKKEELVDDKVSQIVKPPIASQNKEDIVEGKVDEVKPDSKTVIPAGFVEEQRFKDLQSASDKKIHELTSQLQEMESLKETKVALEEFKKEPLVFVSRYFPDIAAQIDVNKHILTKLNSEFGADFEFIPAEAYKPDTPSYKYRTREQQLLSEVRQASEASQAEKRETLRKREALLNESKQRVIKAYGFTEEQFNKEIVEYSKTLSVDYDNIARLKYFDWHIQQAVEQAIKDVKAGKQPKQLPSVAQTRGKTSEEGLEHLRELHDAFGDM